MESIITQIELKEEENEAFEQRVEQETQPFWETATPQERADRWRQWVQSHQGGPNLPDEALRRENMYD